MKVERGPLIILCITSYSGLDYTPGSLGHWTSVGDDFESKSSIQIGHYYFDTNMITYLSPFFVSFLPHSNGPEVEASSGITFSELQFTKDGRVKGSTVASFLNLQGKFTAIVIGGGL